jgi:hypothetical protein
MATIMWDKPKKIMSEEEWKSITADSAPAGVYTPNMSEEDKYKWKGKLIRGKCPRVELRKTCRKSNNRDGGKWTSVYCQLLVVVSFKDIDGMYDCNVRMSMNGKCGMSMDEFLEFNLAVDEAKAVLRTLEN